jgi:hypothetical protein
MATTFDLPNFVGELFSLTPKVTPLLSAVGGLTGGGSPVTSKEFTWQDYTMATRAQPNILEGAAPVSSQRLRTERKNVVQIYQYGVDISYTKLATVGQLGSGGAAPVIPATSILGTQPVQNELAWQLRLKIEQAAMDANFTLHNGAFVNPNDNATARRTRGLLAWITTNAVAAGAVALSDALIDQLLRLMWGNGSPFREPIIYVDIFQKQGISGIYGYAPEHRTIGGVNIQMVETDVAPLGVVLDRDMPDDTLAVYDLSVVEPRWLVIPGKGVFFTEPMAKTKASEEAQLYGELGFALGPETWHGKITGLTTS